MVILSRVVWVEAYTQLSAAGDNLDVLSDGQLVVAYDARKLAMSRSTLTQGMNLDHKLRRWREAGLIDEATRAGIAAFEHAERLPLGMYTLIGLGASTVGLGLVSLVAANWEEIPALLKLCVDLLLGVGLAVLVAQAFRRQWRLAREALITIFYGYTLASLALVGQVYQLNAPTYQALLTWSLATLPLCLLGESLFLSVLYTAGFATAHGFALAELFDVLDAHASDAVARNVVACAVFVSPLLYVLLSFVPWLVAQRPHYVTSLRAFGGSGVVIGGFALAFFWYESLADDHTLTWSLGVTLLIALGFSWLLSRLLHAEPARTRSALASVMPAAWRPVSVTRRRTISVGFRRSPGSACARLSVTAPSGSDCSMR
jgi:hypothetical protein